MEHLVEPADGRILSSRDGSPVSLLGVWTATGQRNGGNREPRKQRSDHGAGLVPGGTRRKRLHDSGSAGSGRCVQRGAGWKRGAFVKNHRTRARYLSCGGFVRKQIPFQLDDSDGFFAAGSAFAL